MIKIRSCLKNVFNLLKQFNVIFNIKSLKEGYFYGGCILSFLIPFNQFVSSCSIVLWLVLSLLSFNKKNINKNNLFLLLPLIYIIYIGSLLYSENEAFYVFERKLSLIAFPLIFFLHKYTGKQQLMMHKLFILGVFVSGLICLSYSIYNSFNIIGGQLVFRANVIAGKDFFESVNFGGNYFFGSHFSIFHQTVYYAIYVCVAIVMLLWKKHVFSKRYRTILLSFFLLLLFLISNKANLLIVCTILIYKLIPYFREVSVVGKITALLASVVFFIFFFFANPRMGASARNILNKGITVENSARYGYSLRLLSWDSAIKLIKESPVFGYGVGDAQDELNAIYESKDYIWPLKRSLNAHNEYFQLWIEVGILGVILFLSIFVILFKYRAQDHQGAWIFPILIILFINAFFESYLNRYSGLLITSYLYCLIISNYNPKNFSFEN